MAQAPKPATVSLLLAMGTALIGGILASGSGAPQLAVAFGITGLFVLTGLLFAKGEAQGQEAQA